MRTYCIDELREEETARLAERLKRAALAAGMPDLYWLPVPETLLNGVQQEHLGECGPYAMALELFPDALRLELLVRARNRLRCDCVAYAGPELVVHMIDHVNGLLRELDIPS